MKTTCTLKNDKETKLQGLISDVIKNPKNLCKQCNNILSHSYGRAYDKFIQYVLNYSELILKNVLLISNKHMNNILFFNNLIYLSAL